MRLWGGRFSEANDARVEAFTSSIDIDRELAADDLAGSIAHVRGLGRAGLLTDDQVDELVAGLTRPGRGRRRRPDRLGPRARGRPPQPRGRRWPSGSGRSPAGCTPAARATTRSPPTCGCGPAGRSTGWTRRCSTSSVRSSTWPSARARPCCPGTTHIQPAQPVLFAHHLLAYVEMAERDRARLADARRRVNVSPLGAGALAGAGYPLDREATAARARLRRRHRELARRGQRPRLRGRGARRRRPRDGPPQPPGRGADLVVEPALRVRARLRCVLDRLLDHAQQEEPRPGRAGPRPRGPGHRRADDDPDPAQGPAADLPARPPGGQGAAVRRGRGLRGEPGHPGRACSRR